MKSQVFWKVSVLTSAEAEETIAEMLQSWSGESPSTYTDVETGETTISVYLQKQPDQIKSRKTLLAELNRIRECGLNIGTGKISLRKLAKEDWANSWKRHFHPMEVSGCLLIQPSWSKRRPRHGQALVVLDPGLSFGTGQHPTTSFCLQEIAAFSKRRLGLKHSQPDVAVKSFLDIGTGSGILAISAAKLGYSPIKAFDFDPEAVRIARANALSNRVLREIHLAQADITKMPRRSAEKFDLVCANLISNLLIAERDRILARLKPDGVLVLAGILNTEFHLVQRIYEQTGLKLKSSRIEKEWRSGAFQF